MEVRLVRLDQSFTKGLAGDTTSPHTSLEPYLDLVDEQTRLDISKFRFLDDARRCLIGRLLVRFALSERCHLSHRSLEFGKTKEGRPYAAHKSLQPFPVDYNVSHDTNLVAIATSDRRDAAENRVGIDVMRIRNPWEGTTVEEFIEGISPQLTLKEETTLASLKTEDAKVEHVLALWTLKEAYVKATGEGLHCDLSQLEFDLDLARAAEQTIGTSSFKGVRLESWVFNLVRLEEGEDHYFVAVVTNLVDVGEGSVRFWRTQPEWLRFVELADVVNKLRNDDYSMT